MDSGNWPGNLSADRWPSVKWQWAPQDGRVNSSSIDTVTHVPDQGSEQNLWSPQNFSQEALLVPCSWSDSPWKQA